MIRLVFVAFITVLKETLENRGVLGQIRARVRAEVFGALDDQVSECRNVYFLQNRLLFFSHVRVL